MEIVYGKAAGGQALPNGVVMRAQGRRGVALDLANGRAESVGREISAPGRGRAATAALEAVNALLSVAAAVRLTARAGRQNPWRPIWRAALAAVCVTGLCAAYAWAMDRLFSARAFAPGWQALLSGLGEAAFFALFIALLRALPPARRAMRYHAAEHMALNAYARRLPLTVRAIAGQSAVHPHCGTTLAVFALAGDVAASFVTPLVAGQARAALAYALIFAAFVWEGFRLTARGARSGIERRLLDFALRCQSLALLEPDARMLETVGRALFLATAEPAPGPDGAPREQAYN